MQRVREPKEFRIGDKVQVKSQYQENTWNNATIKGFSDGKYTVEHRFGSIEVISDKNRLRPQPTFSIGEVVEARSNAGPTFYSGKIIAIDDNGLYTVQYDSHMIEGNRIENGLPEMYEGQQLIRRQDEDVQIIAPDKEPSAADVTPKEDRIDIKVIPNPFQAQNLCVSIENEVPKAEIYCLRYKTFQHILDKIKFLMPVVLDRIKTVGFMRNTTTVHENIVLVRLGYFMIKYTAGNQYEHEIDRLKLYKICRPQIQNAFDMLIGVDYLNDAQFKELQEISEEFNTLLFTLVKKVFFECRLRTKLENVDFSQCFSLDLYPERSHSAGHMFHTDSVKSHVDVSLFSLTYLLQPGVVMKGPTIVKKVSDTSTPGNLQELYPETPENYKEARSRVQLTLAVEDGTTIALDNDIYLHATPDPVVRTRLVGDNSIGIDAPITIFPNRGKTIEHELFSMKSVGKSTLTGREFEETKRQIEHNTENSTRSFVRTWFIRSFPQDLQGNFDNNEYPTLTKMLEGLPEQLLCDTSNPSNIYCQNLNTYLEGDLSSSEKDLFDDIAEYKGTTSIVAVNRFLTPGVILEHVGPLFSLGGAKDEEQNNDTCSIVKKSTDANFDKELKEILGSTENLIIGELPNTSKGGLLMRKMRKAKKTRKIKNVKKTKKIRKMNKKRKNIQSKRKRKYKK
jgi:hypothetical protein